MCLLVVNCILGGLCLSFPPPSSLFPAPSESFIVLCKSVLQKVFWVLLEVYQSGDYSLDFGSFLFLAVICAICELFSTSKVEVLVGVDK